jgi:hypothetical protein
MLGKKILKPLEPNEILSDSGLILNTAENTYNKYTELAAWCNENGAVLEDKGDYYEVIAVSEPSEAEIRKAEITSRIPELKQYLNDTDYAVIKIAEGVATEEEYSEVLAKRKSARTEINVLEEELKSL